jgi:uncharacterized protein (TIGR02001 family)
VSTSVGAANMYYWRGFDLGNGDAAVWGDIRASADVGLYGGLWASSGDATNGTEYDLYAGYGTKFGGDTFGIDVSYWTYSYPSQPVANPAGPGDLAEVILAFTVGPVTLTHYEGVSDLEDYSYDTIGATFDKFGIKYGVHEFDYAHLDLSYAFTDKLSLTLGLVTDDVDGTYNDEAKFVVAYTIPLE